MVEDAAESVFHEVILKPAIAAAFGASVEMRPLASLHKTMLYAVTTLRLPLPL